jgi:hypothetical protein
MALTGGLLHPPPPLVHFPDIMIELILFCPCRCRNDIPWSPEVGSRLQTLLTRCFQRLRDQGFKQRPGEELAASSVLVRDLGLATMELRVTPSCFVGSLV